MSVLPMCTGPALRRVPRLCVDPQPPLPRIAAGDLDRISQHAVWRAANGVVDLKAAALLKPEDVKPMHLFHVPPGPTRFTTDDDLLNTAGAKHMRRFLTHVGRGNE